MQRDDIGTGMKIAGILAALFLVKDILAAVGLGPDVQPGGVVDPGTGDTRPATLTTQDAEVIADALEVDFYPGGLVTLPWENDADAAAQLVKAQNTNDVRLLMNAWGTRGTVLSPMTLAQTVAYYLDADYRQAVNGDYQAKDITIRF
jgi:hypothetical protein